VIDLAVRTAAVLVIVLLPLAVGAQTQTPADKPIATVNGVPIKPTLFQQALRQALAQGRPDSPQLREAIRPLMAELFVQAAAGCRPGRDRRAGDRRGDRYESALRAPDRQAN
jgi:hypothetical protein